MRLPGLICLLAMSVVIAQAGYNSEIHSLDFDDGTVSLFENPNLKSSLELSSDRDNCEYLCLSNVSGRTKLNFDDEIAGLCNNNISGTSSGIFSNKSSKKTSFMADTLIEEKELNREGRWLYYLGSASLSVYYGVALPVAFGGDVSGISAFGVPLLGIGLNYYITKDKEITYGTSYFSYKGGSYGMVNSLLLLHTITDDIKEEHMAASILIGGLGGQIAGFNLANKWNYDRGQGMTLFSHGVYGGGISYLLANLLSESPGPKTNSAAALAGTWAGYYWGKQVADRNLYSDGAILIQNRAILPLFLSLASASVEVFDIEDKQKYGAYLMSTVAGIGTGRYFFSNTDISYEEGVFMSTGTWLGFALGLALIPELGTWFTIPAGGLAGFGITRAITLQSELFEGESFFSDMEYRFSPVLLPKIDMSMTGSTDVAPGVSFNVEL